MSTIDALMSEREGYALRDLPDRVAQVDAEILRLGGTVPASVVVETAAKPKPRSRK